ncbi:hypothetical protein O1611_g6737 [Lasiodiplodia mahajangana]|uniref:Uncharacterized protein n=1 Tax=Lasiodiplodia mahajangana TaxID=1108764 RepID=A0ACC2JHP9_9PEZI|nr:hypothetical protein O1611_g6737 [Lasiodiplodia mahajangana]
MASEKQELTHDEIWDDSALIDSWDQALEEYKKYHSIYRNGGNVNDLVKRENEDENISDAKQVLDEIDESSNHQRLETASEMREEKPDNEQETRNAPIQHEPPRVPGAPPAPTGLLGTVRDEGLKRLLMSWYYAGYYTGYYEGQRDSPQNRNAPE